MKDTIYETTETFRFEVEIPSWSVDALRKAVAKKAKSMAKAFGLPSPLRVASISDEKVLRTDPFFRPIVGRTAVIEGEVIKVAGKHKILARSKAPSKLTKFTRANGKPFLQELRL